jgi:release factor glutamine methyltransferase
MTLVGLPSAQTIKWGRIQSVKAARFLFARVPRLSQSERRTSPQRGRDARAHDSVKKSAQEINLEKKPPEAWPLRDAPLLANEPAGDYSLGKGAAMEPVTEQVLTARQALVLGSRRLARAGVVSPQLDMSLLLARVLGIDRLGLYVDLDRPLTEAEREEARALLARRVRREPMAYILGEKEFFGLALEVGPDVLVPRPETEHLVEAAIAWLEAERERRPEALAADIGTGSGAIAIAVASRCPWSRWIATDLSPAALAVARRNAERHGVADRVEFREGNLLEPLEPEAQAAGLDAILSNPPYVAEADRATLAPDVAEWEPAGALFGGPDGLDALRTLAGGAAALLRPGGLLLLECGHGQAPAVAGMLAATSAFEAIDALRDLAGVERVVRATKRSS